MWAFSAPSTEEMVLAFKFSQLFFNLISHNQYKTTINTSILCLQTCPCFHFETGVLTQKIDLSGLKKFSSSQQ